MNRKTLILLLAILNLAYVAVTAAPLGTAFTYQGRLNDGGQPANGRYDLKFILFDVPEFGFPVGQIITNTALAVSGGLFTAELDFGTNVFTGEARWLEIGVRTNGSGGFTTLVPRQPLTPTPYALYAPRRRDGLRVLQPAGHAAGRPAFDERGPAQLQPGLHRQRHRTPLHWCLQRQRRCAGQRERRHAGRTGF